MLDFSMDPRYVGGIFLTLTKQLGKIRLELFGIHTTSTVTHCSLPTTFIEEVETLLKECRVYKWKHCLAARSMPNVEVETMLKACQEHQFN